MAKKSLLDQPHFTDHDKAREYLEAVRWPSGPVCPHCGSTDGSYALKGKAHRPGLYKCASCRQQFSVTVGTVFERSKVPLNAWLLAVHLLCSSKKGVSAHQIHRTLGVTYKTAWFMCHRIREAMAPGSAGLMGSSGGTVEADEMYVRNPEKARKNAHYKGKGKRGPSNHEQVFALVERGGEVRSFHVTNKNIADVRGLLKANASLDANLMTDESSLYGVVGKKFASHGRSNHSRKQYVKGDIHTNTIEGFFGILRRGLIGTYQHVSAKHLKRYLSEFDFRYNTRQITDGERTAEALKGIDGRRLTYRRTEARA